MVDQVTARMPTTVEAQLWDMPDGVPLLFCRRISIDEDNRTVEISDAHYPADRTEFRFVTPLEPWKNPPAPVRARRANSQWKDTLMNDLGQADREFLTRAIDISRHALEDEGKTPFGALVVVNGEIVAEGTSSVVELLDPTAHAEVMALRHAAIKLQRHLIEDGVMYASSEPCPHVPRGLLLGPHPAACIRSDKP